MRYWIFLAVIFCFPFDNLRAQDNFSESFFNFSKNIQLHMPSIAGSESDLEGNIAYRTYTGKLSVIRSYYADLNFNLRKKESEHSKHILGLGFYNDKEGDFFTKSRILSRYAVHIPLSEDLYFSGGVTFQLINYNFNASGTGASGSSWTWSNSVSTSIYSSSFKLGISYNDLNSPSIRPISYSFTIPSYFTFYGEKIKSISENIQVKGASRCNWKPKLSFNYVLQLGLVFSETIGINALYYAKKGSGVTFDLNKVKLHNGSADISFAYLIPSKSINPAVSQYEINLRLYLDK